MRFGTIRRRFAKRWLSAKDQNPLPSESDYQRPKTVKLLDSLAEFWLCLRYNWSAPIFRGRRDATPRRLAAYQLLHSRSLLLRINPQIEVLRVDEWGRFGNAVMQLRNVIYVAERYGVRAIEFANPHPFFGGDRTGQIALRWGAGPAAMAPTLQGRFFRLQAFRLSAEAEDAARIYRDHLRPLVMREFRNGDPRVRADDLVLHFRAGDVFDGNVNRYYGQPPLAYYLSAVEREQPARVWLVFEDRGNPCVDLAEAALRARGVEVVIQSGTLAEDLKVLMSARRIVAGRGTFVHMIGHLSDCLDKIYVFETRELGALRRLGIGVVSAKDEQGEFTTNVLKGKWRNAPEQRALMLSYPARNLTFIDVAGPD